LNDNKIETAFDFGLINWTNEEGARFPVSMVSSGVWAGAYSLQKAYSLVEVGGGKSTFKSELERIGYLGTMEANHKSNPIGAHFELHIEQGPILENSGGKIGVVRIWGALFFSWSASRAVPLETSTSPFKTFSLESSALETCFAVQQLETSQRSNC
jgi:hypothetical protein